MVDAVRCAVEVRRGMAERNAVVAPDQRLDCCIGINAGDISIDGDDIFGDGFNVGARLEARADFDAAVPGVRSFPRIIRKRTHPGADLAGYEPLFDGLRLAGVPD